MRVSVALWLCDLVIVRLDVCDAVSDAVPDCDGELDDEADCDDVAVGVRPPVTVCVADSDGVPDEVRDTVFVGDCVIEEVFEIVAVAVIVVLCESVDDWLLVIVGVSVCEGERESDCEFDIVAE